MFKKKATMGRTMISWDVIENVIAPYLPLEDIYRAKIQHLLEAETKKRLSTDEPMMVAVSNDDVEMFKYVEPKIDINKLKIIHSINVDHLDPRVGSYILALRYNSPKILKYLIRRDGSLMFKDVINDLGVAIYSWHFSAFRFNQIFEDPEFASLLKKYLPSIYSWSYYWVRPEELRDYLNYVHDHGLCIDKEALDNTSWITINPNNKRKIRELLSSQPDVVHRLQDIWYSPKFASEACNFVPRNWKICEYSSLGYSTEAMDIVTILDCCRRSTYSDYVYHMLSVITYSQ